MRFLECAFKNKIPTVNKPPIKMLVIVKRILLFKIQNKQKITNCSTLKSQIGKLIILTVVKIDRGDLIGGEFIAGTIGRQKKIVFSH